MKLELWLKIFLQPGVQIFKADSAVMNFIQTNNDKKKLNANNKRTR